MYNIYITNMSIVALKRNSKRYTNKLSHEKSFSLNGGYRNQGRVGQTSLSRSITGTKYRGTQPIGNGGCCGRYNLTLLNSNCSNNNPNIIKKSSINTRGMIDSRIKHPTSVYNTSCENSCLGSNQTVKDYSALNKSQSSNIMKIKNTLGGSTNYSLPCCNCKPNYSLSGPFIGVIPSSFQTYNLDDGTIIVGGISMAGDPNNFYKMATLNIPNGYNYKLAGYLHYSSTPTIPLFSDYTNFQSFITSGVNSNTNIDGGSLIYDTYPDNPGYIVTCGNSSDSLPYCNCN